MVPYTNHIYTNPNWFNSTFPTIGKTNMNDISNALEYATKVNINVHENLFDNPYFVDPINQKGTQKIGSARRVVDRWFTHATGSYVSCSAVKDGLQISTTQRNYGSNLYQRVDDEVVKQIAGNTVTCSCISKGEHGFLSLSVYNQNGEIPLGIVRQSVSNIWAPFSVTFLVPEDSTALIFYFSFQSLYDNLPESVLRYVTIAYVKLEIGTISTSYGGSVMSNYENNPPIRDNKPDYEIELKKCQKYFYPILGSSYVGFGNNSDANTLNIMIWFPSTMAGNQIISCSGLELYDTEGQQYKVSSIDYSVFSDGNDCIIMTFKSTSTLSTQDDYRPFGYILKTGAGGYWVADCEM